MCVHIFKEISILTAARKHYVIRVRAEADQFLLSCVKIDTFVIWIQSLFTAIDLSVPLDERQISRDQSIPRSRRRRRRERELQVNNDLVREQQELIRTHYPNLMSTSPLEERAGTAGSRPSTAPPTTRPSTSRSPGAPQECIHESELAVDALRELGLIGGRVRRPRILHRRTANPSPSHSFCPETGKWRPEHSWHPKYDMIYARKCMAVLTSRSPRKSNFLIVNGKQWIVDWSTGALTRCEPPEYGDTYCGGWIMGHNGTPMKA